MGDDRRDYMTLLMMCGFVLIILVFAPKYIEMQRQQRETAKAIRTIVKVYWKLLPQGVRDEVKNIAHGTANTVLIKER